MEELKGRKLTGIERKGSSIIITLEGGYEIEFYVGQYGEQVIGEVSKTEVIFVEVGTI
ncbi:hypothetical protein [Bacillus haynesii]|uniref:hypothetical protein n=1 Tax=Bacillus haynesii TaxID=1925021 RepID=UPI0022810414|nr:hypothetical protein [Bacillus haynesii]MCY9324047.1 hypothetical protein [Bacillus haynesii]